MPFLKGLNNDIKYHKNSNIHTCDVSNTIKYLLFPDLFMILKLLYLPPPNTWK